METLEIVRSLRASIGEAILEEKNSFGETTLEIRKENLLEVLSLLKNTPEYGYETLMDLTGVDYLAPMKRTKIVYWLHNPVNYQRIRITVYVLRDEAMPSVCHLWEGANWYERELFDLFGVRFDGHPDLTRIVMPDDWVGHPLRRDYALTEEPVQFKHGVKVKIPSEIIHPSRSSKNISQLSSNDSKT